MIIEDEHNRTLDEFVQPSPDEEYGPKIEEKNDKQDDYSSGMTKSCIENGYQYVVNNNSEDAKSLKNSQNNKETNAEQEKEQLRLQNTSLDYENEYDLLTELAI